MAQVCCGSPIPQDGTLPPISPRLRRLLSLSWPEATRLVCIAPSLPYGRSFHRRRDPSSKTSKSSRPAQPIPPADSSMVESDGLQPSDHRPFCSTLVGFRQCSTHTGGHDVPISRSALCSSSARLSRCGCSPAACGSPRARLRLRPKRCRGTGTRGNGANFHCHRRLVRLGSGSTRTTPGPSRCRPSSRIQPTTRSISPDSGPLSIRCCAIRCTRRLGSPAVPACSPACGRRRRTSCPSRTAGGSASSPGTGTAAAIRSWRTIPTRSATASTHTRRTSSRRIIR